jgi:hypothetical protein
MNVLFTKTSTLGLMFYKKYRAIFDDNDTNSIETCIKNRERHLLLQINVLPLTRKRIADPTPIYPIIHCYNYTTAQKRECWSIFSFMRKNFAVDLIQKLGFSRAHTHTHTNSSDLSE